MVSLSGGRPVNCTVRCFFMRIAVTLVLMIVAILTLFLLLMGWLGGGVGVRVGGNLFDDVIGLGT